MDNNQFVLGVALFMVIATVMVSISMFERKHMPAEPVYARYECRFENYCEGLRCDMDLPPDFLLFPFGLGDQPQIARTGDERRLLSMQHLADGSYSSNLREGRRLQVAIRETGAMTYQETSLEQDSLVLAKGEGWCIGPVTPAPNSTSEKAN
jgi:hypothetical protein